MKINFINIIALSIAVLTFGSCTKWLNVQPEDRYTEDQVFSNAQGFEDALNGVYLNLGSNALYGDNLTLTVTDVLSQLYKTNTYSSHPFYSLANYNYTDKDVKKRFEQIWTQAYVGIANINKLLENVDSKGNEVLGESRKKTMKGELLGIRGFLHFDLLRLFGPVYDTSDSTALTIPYYNAVAAKTEPFLPANQVMDFILKDLSAAVSLLEEDPARKDGYKNQNNLRFNYFAALGIKARALLWRKDYEGAKAAAQKVIDSSDLFPWIVGSKITADVQNPDRVFYTELLFSVYSLNLYNNYNEYFYYERTDNVLAGGSAAFINKVFENKAGDYRNSPMWKVPPLGVSYPTFFKYADIADKRAGSQQQRNIIPVIRLSEMYYILAETEKDQTKALSSLNTVLNHRGVASLEAGVDLQAEILKEYRKEFYGEGQLWFFHKRNKVAKVLSAQVSNNNGTIPSSAWVIPIPDDEFANR